MWEKSLICPVSQHGFTQKKYRQTSNVKRVLVGNKIVYHPAVVGSSAVGAAPTTFSTHQLASID